MKSILITGASDGIGRSVAVNLSQKGHSIIICGRNKKRLQETADLCEAETQQLVFDLNNSEERNTELEKIKELDVIINNAGVWHKVGSLESIDDNVIEDVISTNLTSQILLTKKLLPLIKEKPGSAIINISSKSGITAQAGQSVYSASKWGLKGFTDVLREDLAGYPVRVSGVYQSGTNTKLFEKTGEDFPVESFTEPDDLAEAIAFMIDSPEKLQIDEIRIEKK